MRKLGFVLFLMMAFVSLIFSGCKKDDEGPSYSFKDQDLSGKIGNIAWTYLDGRAEIEVSGDEETLDIDIGAISMTDPCSETIGGNSIFFGIPNVVGVYPLKFNWFDWTDEENQTVTLYEPDGSVNNIATKGAVEILSVTETEVTGRIDARCDDENYINGNFIITLCN